MFFSQRKFLHSVKRYLCGCLALSKSVHCTQTARQVFNCSQGGNATRYRVVVVGCRCCLPCLFPHPHCSVSYLSVPLSFLSHFPCDLSLSLSARQVCRSLSLSLSLSVSAFQTRTNVFFWSWYVGLSTDTNTHTHTLSLSVVASLTCG